MTHNEIKNIAHAINPYWWNDDIDLLDFARALLARAAPQPSAEPVAYIHTPSVLMEGVVRPVVSFEKYEDDYNSGIYSVRIPLYTAPQPDDTDLLRQALEALERVLPLAKDSTTQPSLDIDILDAVSAIAALRERLGEKP